MAYLKFLDSQKIIQCIVVPESEHIVTLKFHDAVTVDKSGFDLFLDEQGELDIGGDSYHGYNTVYRNDDTTAEYNGYQLSNDGSVYEKQTQPTPVEPTLDELKEQKIAEMNTAQQESIQNGVDVTLSDGTIEHFTLTDHDQTSLMGLQTKVAQGETQIPWHTSDVNEPCKYYSNTDMALITETAMQAVTFAVTYFRDLRIYINSLEDSTSVQNVTYGMTIPKEYRSEVLADIYASKGIA
jgi:hypothetical protein